MKDDHQPTADGPADRLIIEMALGLRAMSWRLIVYPFIAAVLLTLYSFTRPLRYTATVTMLPQEQTSTGGFLGQFIDTSLLGAGSGNLEPFYQEILYSDTLLDKVIDSRYPRTTAGDSTSLYAILGVKRKVRSAADSLLAAKNLKDTLRGSVLSFNKDKSTGIMKLQCSVPRYPVVSSALANSLVELLDRFAIAHRSRNAKQKRQFIQQRLKVAKAELDSINGMIAVFVEKNRRYMDSPALLEQYQELQRSSTAQTSLWTELKRQLESARIEEMKNTSSVDVLQYAHTPLRKSAPRRSRYFIMGYFLGLFLLPIWQLISMRRHRRLGSALMA